MEKQLNQDMYLNLALDYCAHWHEKEAVREIVANARDVCPEDFEIKIEGRNLIISNGEAFSTTGEKVTLLPEHWTIGKSQKHIENPIGRFGEGLKVASTVLLRLGYTDIHIRSGYYSYYPYVNYNPYVEEDQQTKDVIWVEMLKEEHYHPGTQVMIKNWQADTFDELFVFPEDERILFSTPTRDLLYCDIEEEPKLYIGNVFICELRSLGQGRFHFSYNLNGEQITIGRDRNMPTTYEVLNEIGRLWGAIDRIDLWEKLWKAVDRGEGEAGISWFFLRYDGIRELRDIWLTALHSAYESEVVLQTNLTISNYVLNEGKYLPIVLSDKNHLHEFLEWLGVKKDIDIELEFNESLLLDIPDSFELNRMQKINLKMLETRIKKLAEHLKFEIFTIKIVDIGLTEDGELILSQIDKEHSLSFIHASVLEDRVKTFEIMLDQMAMHWYNTKRSDYDDTYIDTILFLAATLSTRMI